MSKALFIGRTLPALEPGVYLNAFNLRTDQLVRATLAAGHEVVLCAQSRNRSGRLPVTVRSPGFVQIALDFGQATWVRQLQKISDDTLPDCVVGVGLAGSLAATRLRNRPPLWLDLYGDSMAENQVRMHATATDTGIASTRSSERIAMVSGDVFSTLSEPQRFALIGKLGSAGRLNRHTFGYKLVHAIPAAANPELETGPGNFELRGKLVPEDAFVVFWCGGYNAWADADTLFEGLTYAMEREARICYVSIGDAVVDPHGYPRFCARVASSSLKAHFHLLGSGRSRGEILDYYRQADVGICVDRACYETELGSRTRVLEMLPAGLPVVMSSGCELSREVASLGAGRTFPIGDAEALGKLLLDLFQDTDALAACSRAAIVAARGPLSYSVTARPLIDWITSPHRAPDRLPGALTGLTFDRLRGAARSLRWHVAPRLG